MNSRLPSAALAAPMRASRSSGDASTKDAASGLWSRTIRSNDTPAAVVPTKSDADGVQAHGCVLAPEQHLAPVDGEVGRAQSVEGGLGDQDGVACLFGVFLDACCHVDYVSDHGEVELAGGADRTRDHLARVDADAEPH